jgi:hypothetical protein
MKTYVAITGVLFALVVAAHVWRMFLEPRLVHEASFWLITAFAAGMSAWAFIVLRRSSRS